MRANNEKGSSSNTSQEFYTPITYQQDRNCRWKWFSISNLQLIWCMEIYKIWYADLLPKLGAIWGNSVFPWKWAVQSKKTVIIYFIKWPTFTCPSVRGVIKGQWLTAYQCVWESAFALCMKRMLLAGNHNVRQKVVICDLFFSVAKWFSLLWNYCFPSVSKRLNLLVCRINNIPVIHKFESSSV